MKNWKPFEREIVRKLKSLGFKAQRNWSRQFIDSDGCDIVASNREKNYVFQVKYGKSPSLKQAYNEALNARRYTHDVPVGVCRFSQTRETVVVLSWKTFQTLFTDTG